MSILEEFKSFVLKGSMVDLAIGVIIGVVFGKVVSSLVADVIMPPIGLLLGGVDFSALQILLKPAAGTQPAVSIRYGLFINAVIDFVIVSAVIFAVIKGVNKLRREKPPATKECPECLSTIPLQAKRCKCCTSIQTT